MDEPVNLDGFQVVRGEFFAHTHEPAFTFNHCRVSLNTACLKQLPDVDYVQVLVNEHTKKLLVRPCPEDATDSVLWCTASSIHSDNKKPKQITCRIFFAKIITLMDWNPDFRYKLLGKLIRSNGQSLFFFDLACAESYQRILKDGEKPKTSRTPVFPARWRDQFGVLEKEHRGLRQVSVFDGYTVFSLNNDVPPKDDAPIDLDGFVPMSGGV